MNTNSSRLLIFLKIHFLNPIIGGKLILERRQIYAILELNMTKRTFHKINHCCQAKL